MNDQMQHDLNRIRKVFNKDLYKPNNFYASFYLIFGFVFYFLSLLLGYLVIANKLFYLLPLNWFLIGTAQTTLFVIGHDCAHQSFFSKKRVNNFWGQICFAPVFYPYYAWKYSHAAHHLYTNQLDIHESDVYYDNAWVPITLEQYRKYKDEKKIFILFVHRLSRYVPPLGAAIHNIHIHFFINKFKSDHKKDVLYSYFCLFFLFSVLNIFVFEMTKSWLVNFNLIFLPIIFFQWWMSLYTFQHHTSQNIKLYKKEEWTPYLGQVLGTFNSISPKWLSFIHLNIEYHLPHHLSTAIPSYKLQEAYRILKASIYNKHILENKLSLKYYFNQVKNCHLWDEQRSCYVRYSEA